MLGKMEYMTMRLTRMLLSSAAALAFMAGPALAQPAPNQYQHNGAGMMSPEGQQPYHESQHGAMAPGNTSQQDNHGPMGPGNMDHQDSHGPMGPGNQQTYHESQHGAMGSGNMGYQEDHGGYHNGPSGPHGGWARGDHFDRQRDVIHHGDWDRYHLHAPPQGYEWVRSGNQFILIAITSGIIASIIAGSVYGY